MSQNADPHAQPIPATDMPDIACSRGFGSWLASHRVSIALSSYQAGQLFLIGRLPDGRISFFRRDFERAMGLWYEADRLYLASMVQIWRLENVLAPGETANEHFDRLFVARQANITGDVDAHEIAVEAGGRVVFVNTRHSCLATFSERHSFRPLWKPPFISKLAAEDRCHLNGLATESGHVRYVTCCARTDAVDGWRDRRVGSGLVIRVEDGEVVADGFTMPHSPRVYRGRLYVLDSGRGYLVRVDPATGAREDIAFCPGFLRGLSFHDGHALVTLSLPRYSTFAGLPLEEELTRRGVSPRCGIMIVNLASGDVVEWLTCDTVIRELFDVAAIPGAACPMVAPIRGADFANLLTIEAPERCTDRWRG